MIGSGPCPPKGGLCGLLYAVVGLVCGIGKLLG
jgi:hypothetical protein